VKWWQRNKERLFPCDSSGTLEAGAITIILGMFGAANPVDGQPVTR
jgi:hypothetical protein